MTTYELIKLVVVNSKLLFSVASSYSLARSSILVFRLVTLLGILPLIFTLPVNVSRTDPRCELLGDDVASVCKLSIFGSNRTIYINILNQSQLAHFVSSLFIRLKSQFFSDFSRCNRSVSEAVCILTMPQCESIHSGKVVFQRLCKESCQQIFSNCSQVFTAALSQLQNFTYHHGYITFQCNGLASAQDPDLKEKCLHADSALLSTLPK